MDMEKIRITRLAAENVKRLVAVDMQTGRIENMQIVDGTPSDESDGSDKKEGE